MIPSLIFQKFLELYIFLLKSLEYCSEMIYNIYCMVSFDLLVFVCT